MKVTTERMENCQIKMIVEMDAAEIDGKLRVTARKLSRQFTVPGYRKGKAPFHAVIRVFGREAVQQQALEDFGNEWYDQAVEQIEVKPYQAGELQSVEWDPFRMTVLLPIEPEVDLGDYRSVRVAFEVGPVADEQIEEYLADLQKRHAQWVPVERPAAFGDQVVLDLVGKAGDETFMDHEEYEMLLKAEARHPLAGLPEQIAGMSAGEEKTFTLPVPEDDPHTSVAGKEATITARLHTVKEEDLPPLDDELALMVGDYETLDDLRAATRERLEKEATERAESAYLDKVLDAMIEGSVKIEYPPQAVDRESDLALNRLDRNLRSSGLEMETYLGIIGKTREVYKQELRPASEERLKKRLVLTEVASREGLTVEEEEIDREIDRLTDLMGDQPESMREMLQSPVGRLSVADDLLVARVQERVIQIAKGEAPPLETASAAGLPVLQSTARAATLPPPEAVAAGSGEPGGPEAGEAPPLEMASAAGLPVLQSTARAATLPPPEAVAARPGEPGGPEAEAEGSAPSAPEATPAEEREPVEEAESAEAS
jgi:trigger factor